MFYYGFFMVSFIEIFFSLRERWDLLATNQCQIFEFQFQSHKHETCARPQKRQIHLCYFVPLKKQQQPRGGALPPYNGQDGETHKSKYMKGWGNLSFRYLGLSLKYFEQPVL